MSGGVELLALPDGSGEREEDSMVNHGEDERDGSGEREEDSVSSWMPAGFEGRSSVSRGVLSTGGVSISISTPVRCASASLDGVDFEEPISAPLPALAESSARYSDSSGEARSRGLCVRVVLCCLAISLLWLSSLSVARSIASRFVAAPTTLEMQNAWYSVMDIVRSEEIAATTCMENNIERCSGSLNRTADQQLQQSTRHTKRNAELVLDAQIEANSAVVQWDKVLSASQALASGLQAEPGYTGCSKLACFGLVSNETGLCGVGDEKQLDKWLLSNADVSSSAYLLNEDHVQKQQALFADTVEGAQKRAAYDDKYVDNKTFVIRDVRADLGNLTDEFTLEPELADGVANVTDKFHDLEDCLDFSETSACREAREFRQSVDLKLEDLENFMVFMKSQFESVMEDIHSYRLDVDAKLDDFLDLYNAMDSFASEINDAIPNFDFVASFPNPSVAYDGSLPSLESSLFDIPSTAWEDFVDLIDASDIEAAFAAAAHRLKESVVAAGEGFATDVEVATSPLRGAFEDYDPPEADAHSDEYEKNNRQFLSDTAGVLGEYEHYTPPNASLSSGEVRSYDFPSGFGFLSDLSFNGRGYQGELDVEPLFAFMNFVLDWIVWADIMWRVIQSLRIIKRFLSHAGDDLPVIDERESQTMSKRRRPAVIFVAVATHPVVVSVIIAGISLLGFSIGLRLYYPMYTSYRQGCVHTKNGTVLTQNAFSVAYNFASQESNEMMADSLSRFDNQRMELCSEHGEPSQRAFQEHDNTMVGSRQSADMMAESLAQYFNCINGSHASFVDKDLFANLTGGQEGAQNPFKQQQLDASRFFIERHSGFIKAQPGGEKAYADQYELRGLSVYNCSALPLCEITCKGADERLLEVATWQAGCFSEMLFHSIVFRFIIGVSIFVCLNASRVLLVGGLVKIFWRDFTSHGFSFLGNVESNGVVKDSVEPRLRERVTTFTRKWTLQGLALVFLAFAVHAPYIAALVLHERA